MDIFRFIANVGMVGLARARVDFFMFVESSHLFSEVLGEDTEKVQVTERHLQETSVPSSWYDEGRLLVTVRFGNSRTMNFCQKRVTERTHNGKTKVEFTVYVILRKGLDNCNPLNGGSQE